MAFWATRGTGTWGHQVWVSPYRNEVEYLFGSNIAGYRCHSSYSSVMVCYHRFERACGSLAPGEMVYIETKQKFPGEGT